jgi:hypothetical protein
MLRECYELLRRRGRLGILFVVILEELRLPFGYLPSSILVQCPHPYELKTYINSIKPARI